MASGEDVWRELDDAARALTEAAARGVRDVMKMPEAEDLVPRIFEASSMLTALASDGRRAAADHSTDELRDLLRLKSAFLDMTAHELRRPLALVNGYVSNIEEGAFGAVPDELRPGLRRVGAGVAEIAHLLDGLATIARLEDGADALDRRPHPLGELVAEAVRAVEAEATAKGILVDEQLPQPDIVATIDRDRLRTAVINLLGNAVKYAPEKSPVTILIGEYNDSVGIVVTDQGPGIDPADRNRIFEKWHRSPKSSGKDGLGLGLYIVRVVVELHGGRVNVQSESGRGSTFTVVLPREPSGPSHQPC